MRRYAFYIAVALLAFGIGLFFVFKFYRIAEEKMVSKIEPRITTETPSNKTVGIGFGTGEGIGEFNNSAYVPKLYKPTCSNKNLLPIWNELRKDREFKSREDEFYQTGDCSDLIEIDRVDLDGDRQKEFIVWGRYTFSGATGNSLIWIYEKKNGRYKQLLQSYAYKNGDEEKWFEVKKNKTRGYQNLLLKGHYSGYETTHRAYKFNGNKYIETKCRFQIYLLNEEKPYFITCQEYYEKTEKELRESEERLKNQ